MSQPFASSDETRGHRPDGDLRAAVTAGKRVAVVQSNYIPWRGYFDIIGLVDEFVLYDIVQYTKRDWRNRNKIKTAQGPQWLTIPVETAGRFHQTIADTRIADRGWAERHWRAIVRAYEKAPYFDRYREEFLERYTVCGEMDHLTSVNRSLIGLVVAALGLRTAVTHAAECGGDRNARLLNVCRAAGASVYVSGPSARSYLDVELFRQSGVEVEFMDYSGYRAYPQLHGPFEPAVSVIDLLFNVGPAAKSYMLCESRRS